MATVRFRLFGSDSQAGTMLTRLHGIDGVARVEEVADQIHARDDSSSLGLPDDTGPDFHCIEVRARNEKLAREVRELIATTAQDLNAVVEFVDRF